VRWVASISTGAFGYPLEEAANISVKALRETHCSIRSVLLVAFDERMALTWDAALKEAGGQ
jgi:O-acetyl-ADP-ribose deacetylase (regulator of RNase III)